MTDAEVRVDDVMVVARLKAEQRIRPATAAALLEHLVGWTGPTITEAEVLLLAEALDG